MTRRRPGLFAIRTDDEHAVVKGRLLLWLLLVLSVLNIVYAAITLVETKFPATVAVILTFVQGLYFTGIVLTRRGYVDTTAWLTAGPLTAVTLLSPLALNGARSHTTLLVIPMLVTAFTARPRTTWALFAIQTAGLVFLELGVPPSPLEAGLPVNFLPTVGITLLLLASVSSLNQQLVTSMTSRLQQSREREHDLRVQAEDASRAKNLFLASMSHELRTPLNAIIGYAELLGETLEPDEVDAESMRDVGRIQAAGKHLLALVSNVLDISKIEAGRMTLNVEAIDARSIVSDVARTLEPMATEQQDRLDVSMPDHEVLMHTDATKLRQILFNLVANAVKFTEHGQIDLKLAAATPRPDWVTVTVRDTGPGMNDDLVEKLFDAFVQGEGSTTRRYGGTGLGLAISQRFAHMLGGRVGVVSAPGEGTTFTVELPQDLDTIDLTQSAVAT